jgi:uncharacterized membrane protein YphA (DoxX/SURF4 family)
VVTFRRVEVRPSPVDAAPPAAGSARTGPSPDELQRWLLRSGLAFVFLYASVSAMLDADAFVRYVPGIVSSAVATHVFLPLFAVYELGLAVGLLSGRRTYPLAVLAALTLGAIVVVNPDAFAVLFRNVAIICAALSLAVQSRPAPAAPAP